MAASTSLSHTFFFFFFMVCFIISIDHAACARLSYASISQLLPEDLYKKIFLHKDDSACPAKGFYTYDAFTSSTECFPKFAATGCTDTRKRELAAFLAQISHESTGGWLTAPDGPYAWGLCYKEALNSTNDCCDSTNKDWPCYPNKSYKGRGPIELSWNYNYGPAGVALGFDGLREPELVANRSDLAFKTALWFWMTPRDDKPSCHDVMVGQFTPNEADLAANRTAGFGLVTNIINGGYECGIPNNPQVNDRIGYYKRYAALFEVDVGPNLDCANQMHY